MKVNGVCVERGRTIAKKIAISFGLFFNSRAAVGQLIFSSIILLAGCFVIPLQAQLFVDFEAGLASAGYNDVRVPGNGGTPFSLTDDLKSKTTSFIRFRPGLRFSERHNISLLYAPLTIKSSGIVDHPINFQGTMFAAGRVLSGEYTFNSLRLTYRYDLIADSNFQLGLGITGNIRDASITLTNADTSVEETNFGFVPLLNFYMKWMPGNNFGLLLDGDALVGPQGRAEDLFLGVTYRIAGGFDARIGYRLLEGGADVDEVYNFALIHFGVIGVTLWL